MENLLGRKWEIYSEIENNLTIDAVINLGRIHLEKTQKLEKAIEEILQQKQMPSKEAIEALKTSETLISDVAKQCIKIQEEVGEEDITTDAFNAIRQADTILQALTGKPDFEKFLTAVSSKDKYDRYGLLIDGDEISEDPPFHFPVVASARSTSLSFFRLVSAKLRALLLFLTAARTISLSFFMLMSAY